MRPELLFRLLLSSLFLLTPDLTSAQTESTSSWILVEVISARVPGARPGGQQWDATPAEQSNLLCAAATAGAGMYAGQAVGTATAQLCAAVAPVRRADAPPSDPDVVVDFDFGASRAHIRTGEATDTAAPEWRFSFYVDAATLRPQILANVVDVDADRDDAIGSLTIRKDEILAAAVTGSLVELTDPSGLVLRLRATDANQPEMLEPRVVTFDVPANGTAAAPLGGSAIPIGARVHVVAVGDVLLGPVGHYAPTDPAGTRDLAPRAANYPEFPNDNFGALLMLTGTHERARQWAVVGRCLDTTAAFSGIPIFTVNDTRRGDNSGSFVVTLTIEPPSSAADGTVAASRCSSTSGATSGASGEDTGASAPVGSTARTMIVGFEVVPPPRKDNNAPWDGDGSLPDLEIRVFMNGRAVGRSGIAQDSAGARFDPPGSFDSTQGALQIEVWDSDAFDDDRIGSVTIDLARGQLEGTLGNGGFVRAIVVDETP